MDAIAEQIVAGKRFGGRNAVTGEMDGVRRSIPGNYDDNGHKWVDGEKRFARHGDGNDNEMPSAEEKKAIEDFDRMNPSQFGAHRIWVSRGDFARIQHQKPQFLVGHDRYGDDRDLFMGYIPHLDSKTGGVLTDVYACEYQGDEMFMPYNKKTIASDSDRDIMSAYEEIRNIFPDGMRKEEPTVSTGVRDLGVPEGQRRESAGNGRLVAVKGYSAGRTGNSEDDRAVNGASGSSELDVKDNGVRYSRVSDKSRIDEFDKARREGRTVKTIRSFVEVDGKLYSPTSTEVDWLKKKTRRYRKWCRRDCVFQQFPIIPNLADWRKKFVPIEKQKCGFWDIFEIM